MKSDREGEVSYGIPDVWNLKRNDTNEVTKETHRLREGIYGCQGGRVGGRDKLRSLRWTCTHCCV